MKVTVEMNEEELREFLRYREDKEIVHKEADDANKLTIALAKKVTYAIDRKAETPDEAEIIDEDHAAELLEMAEEILGS